ncbi:DUF596 domain-containing protein [Budviciaceae bacterium BWR-B9]|uniref:DUF596 domain-containing protein n=1 Tax=Limnobaculum allomyrinae TaxID=2791986 RepID=A0ABS1ISQ2_9GAMM|nr:MULTISPECIES: DUF596 domain-containing protein [Limnobaculum]MBK5144773.1 DUF596 domain-containing protein [Limnobaculum allomyrinae]MBV7692436.1 DUF596 domain-containing protein [Limnobaculum sp. M2-1]
MVTDNEYKTILKYAETQALNGLCAYIALFLLSSIHTEYEDFPFLKRKAIFFWFLEKLLKAGRIKLAKHGSFLKGTVSEQVKCFKLSFPKTEEEIENGLWFFDESCPGGAVWILEDGYLEWT